MAVPYYQGVSLPFVASIVIGTIQLGATVDYAIVYTNRYLKERRNGKNKLEAISIAHKSNMLSIITSALSLFAATYGVACYSQVDMLVLFVHCWQEVLLQYDRCSHTAAYDVPYL